MLMWFLKRVTSFFPKVNWRDITTQVKEGLPYFLLAIFGTIYYRIDSIMLSKMVPEPVVGWYGGAYRLFDMLNFFPVIFTTAIFPVLSRLWGREEQAHKRTTQRSLEFMILIGIPVSIGAIVICRQRSSISLWIIGVCVRPSLFSKYFQRGSYSYLWIW